MLKKINSIHILLTFLVVLLLINAGITFHNGGVVQDNIKLKLQTDQAKLYLNAILYDLIHGADLSVRGYFITKNPQLADPLKIVLLHKDSIFNNLESILNQQNYREMAEFQKMRDASEEYLTFSTSMLDVAKSDSNALFIKLLNEDKGYTWWKAYQPVRDSLVLYEDQLNRDVERKFNYSSTANKIIQVLLLVIGIPVIGFIIHRLNSEEKARFALVAQMEENNRKYMFNPGNKSETTSAEQIAQTFINNFKQANHFITRISQGDFKVEWDGFNSNSEVNENTLAGKMMEMRNRMHILKEEEERRLWLNEGLANFSELVRNYQNTVDELSNQAIRFICKYLHAQQGSIFTLHKTEEEEQYLILSACFAFDKKKFIEKRIEIGNGLVGQVYLEGNTVLLTEIPKQYLKITSGLGESSPTCIAIVPMKYNTKTEAVLELATFTKLQPYQLAFLERCGDFFASTLRSIKS